MDAAARNDADAGFVDVDAMVADADATDAGRLMPGTAIQLTDGLGSGSKPSLVWTGSNYGVAWHDSRNVGGTEIYFALLDGSGARIGAEVRVSNAMGSSTHPSLVWTGSEFGVAWADDRDGAELEVYFARLSADGTPVGPEVRVTDAAGYSRDVSLVWTGSNFALAWEDARDGPDQVYVAVLSATGVETTADVRVSTSATGQRDPSLAWTGSELGLVWQDFRETSSEIFLARLDSAGVVLDPAVRVTDALMPSREPVLANTDGGFAVAFSDQRTGISDIYIEQLDGSGAPSGTQRVSVAPSQAGRPSLVSTPAGLGVAWDSNVTGTGDVYFALVDSSGLVGERILISNGIDEASDPSIVWTGSSFAIAWESQRSGEEVYFRLLSY